MKSKKMKKIIGRRRNGEGSVVQRSDGRYQASRMINGERKFFYSWYEVECYRWLDELKAKEIQGMPITGDNVKFEDYAKSYIDRYATSYVKPATLKNYQGYVENYIIDSSLGKMKIVRERDRKKNKICQDHGFELIRVENPYARRYNFIKDVLIDYFGKRRRSGIVKKCAVGEYPKSWIVRYQAA